VILTARLETKNHEPRSSRYDYQKNNNHELNAVAHENNSAKIQKRQDCASNTNTLQRIHFVGITTGDSGISRFLQANRRNASTAKQNQQQGTPNQNGTSALDDLQIKQRKDEGQGSTDGNDSPAVGKITDGTSGDSRDGVEISVGGERGIQNRRKTQFEI
jgi:hypothetical protein